MFIITLIKDIFCAVQVRLYSESNYITKQTTLILGLDSSLSEYFGGEINLNNKMLKNEMRIFIKVPDHLDLKYKKIINNNFNFFITTVDTSLLKFGKSIDMNFILDIEVFRRTVSLNIQDFCQESCVYQMSFDFIPPILIQKLIKIGKDDYKGCLDMLKQSNILNTDDIKDQLNQISDTYSALENKYSKTIFHSENYDEKKIYYGDVQNFKSSKEENPELYFQEDDINFKKIEWIKYDKKYNFIKDILKVNEIIRGIKNNIKYLNESDSNDKINFELSKDVKENLSLILNEENIKGDIIQYKPSIAEKVCPYIIILSSILFSAFN